MLFFEGGGGKVGFSLLLSNDVDPRCLLRVSVNKNQTKSEIIRKNVKIQIRSNSGY